MKGKINSLRPSANHRFHSLRLDFALMCDCQPSCCVLDYLRTTLHASLNQGGINKKTQKTLQVFLLLLLLFVDNEFNFFFWFINYRNYFYASKNLSEIL